MLANYEVEQGNAGYSDVRSGLGREILPLKLERGWTTCIYCFHPMYGDYHCVNLKRQSVSVLQSGVCLSFLTNACLPLRGFWALYDYFVCICIWHLSTFRCRHNNSDTVIMLSECSTFKLSILHGSPGDKQMIQWCVDDANVTSAGSWLTVWLTQLAMIKRWWMKPSFSGDPERWGKKGKATPDPYISWSVLRLDGFRPTFAS